MALIQIRELSIGFRGPPLLEAASCTIDAGERIALLGRNGAGKTTLLKLLSGQLQPDAGEVVLAGGVRVALLPQDVPQGLAGTVHDVVAGGFGDGADDPELRWRLEQQLERLVVEMRLDTAAEFAALSAGMKRRVLLARALVASPDVLLLDEPTNHLDLDSIAWLEDYLGRIDVTLVFVTHDRAFMRRLANRILEIDRGRLFDWSCDYETFLVRKEALLDAEEKQQALFDKKLAIEEVWIRTGIKARRTRNEGRVRALEQMRRERSQRRERQRDVRLNIQEAERSGTLVAELERVSFAYEERPVLREVSTMILRGDKVGILGPNGAGKSTLLRLLLGKLRPTAGKARLGTNLQIAYFDQLRQQLDGEASVAENVGEGSDTVTIGGRPRHVIGYLEEFLFTPERSRTAVKFLSGGECNRVLLAKLFAKPANVIVLDEPTNDLDAETLELLEAHVVEFNGTVLAVSHDREFLNRVVTSTLVFEGDAVREYVGGYDDWLRQRQPEAKPEEERGARAATGKVAAGSGAAGRGAEGRDSAANVAAGAVPERRRLSFKQQQELAALPATIERLETEIGRLHAEMATEDFYRQAGEVIAERQALLKQYGEELEQAFGRWAELEEGA